MSSGCAFGVIILFDTACVQDEVDKSNLIASSFFVMGITTFVQCTLGTRLPIAQGPSIVFYPVAIGIMAGDSLECPGPTGIAAEGFGCFLSGLFGLPVGPTSYSNNIAAISMTKVASRRVMHATSAIMVVFGLFPKLSALFVCVPDPIIGGVLLATIGIICGVAAGSLSTRKERGLEVQSQATDTTGATKLSQTEAELRWQRCAFGVIILFDAACVQDEVDKSNLIASSFFVMGITTFVQCTLGTRLPIAQGPSIPGEKIWHRRVGQVAGTIAAGSIVQLLIGSTGVMSHLLRFVSPLVVAPTIFLIGFSVMGAVLNLCAPQFYISIVCCILIIVFTYVLDRVKIPIPYFSIRNRKPLVTRFAAFSTLPILLSMAIMYALCHLLTVTNVLPSSPEAWGYGARTDIKKTVLPVSGIAAEGFGCFLSGLFGLPVGPTSYSNNIAAISMTKVASRRVMHATSAIMVIFGLFPKLSALFVCVPDPIIGGVLLATIGIICGVAAGSLSSVRMDRPRNAFVFGFSVFLGVVVPLQIKASRHRDATSMSDSAQAIAMGIAQDLLSNEMLVGTGTALLLDSCLPGTRKERGLEAEANQGADSVTPGSCQTEAELRWQVDCYESTAFHRFYSRHLPILHRLPLFPGRLSERRANAVCENRETAI
uniref:Sulfate_transp domain-containing protein n=1 Tax=Macrostomum lignano TaxID=282301 RepID=A0A1I8HMH5_9PLAT